MKQDKSMYPQSLGKALNITDTKRLLISKEELVSLYLKIVIF